MGIPTSYKPQPLVQESISGTHIKVDSITQLQLKSLIVLGVTSVECKEGMVPFYVVELNSIAFYLNFDLSNLVHILSVYKGKVVRVVSDGIEKVLEVADLYNFLL